MSQNEEIERVYADHFKLLFESLKLNRVRDNSKNGPPKMVVFKNEHFIATFTTERGPVECCLSSLFDSGVQYRPLPVHMFYLTVQLTKARDMSDGTRRRVLKLNVTYAQQAKFMADYAPHIGFLLNKSNYRMTWEYIEGLFAVA